MYYEKSLNASETLQATSYNLLVHIDDIVRRIQLRFGGSNGTGNQQTTSEF